VRIRLHRAWIVTALGHVLAMRPAGSELPIPSDMCQLHGCGSKGPSSDLSNSGEHSRMQYGRFGGPADNDHGRCFVGLDQLDHERVDCIDLALCQFG
jgi:hypothetical protein